MGVKAKMEELTFGSHVIPSVEKNVLIRKVLQSIRTLSKMTTPHLFPHHHFPPRSLPADDLRSYFPEKRTVMKRTPPPPFSLFPYYNGYYLT